MTTTMLDSQLDQETDPGGGLLSSLITALTSNENNNSYDDNNHLSSFFINSSYNEFSSSTSSSQDSLIFDNHYDDSSPTLLTSFSSSSADMDGNSSIPFLPNHPSLVSQLSPSSLIPHLLSSATSTLFATHRHLSEPTADTLLQSNDPTTLTDPLSTLSSSTTSSSTTTTNTTPLWFDILAQILSSALLFLLIFGMSATVDTQHLREQVHNKFAILTGVSTQFLIMPLLGYLSVILLKDCQGFTEPMALSLLIVTASPGGSYSNWWCSMFNADLALSVTMTAISTMISSIMLPANLLLYVNAAFGFGATGDDSNTGQDGGEEEEEGDILKNIDWGSLFVSLAIVIVAIGLGLCASFKISSHRFNRFANRMGSMAGVLLIVLSAVLTSISGNGDAQVWGQPWSFYVGVSLPCFVGLVISTCLAVLARLKKPEVVSVGVECCYQNVGICTSAVITIFSDPVERGQALCVPLFYGLMEAVVLGLYCIIAWKFGWTKAPRDDKFCTMIMTTYEVMDDESGFENDQHHSHHDEDEDVEAAQSVDIHEEDVHEAPHSPLSSAGNATRSSDVDTWRSSSTTSSGWSRWPWSMFRIFHGGATASPYKKRKDDEHSINAPPSPPRRISLASAVREGLESITEDGFGSPGSLVSFKEEEKGSYTRCRINSEDSVTAITVAMSEDSPSANTNMDSSNHNSPTFRRKSSSNSLMKGNF